MKNKTCICSVCKKELKTQEKDGSCKIVGHYNYDGKAYCEKCWGDGVRIRGVK